MDSCLVCGTQFMRKYQKGGQRQIYCSKKCKYQDAYLEKICLTCNKPFRTNKLSTRKDYCSLACITRSPCQMCGKIITGRASFQSGERRFCSRYCASVVNRAISGKHNYTFKGFVATIQRVGDLQCESCGLNDQTTLVVHHRDRDRGNNTPDNLQTLCANCHFRIHWTSSVHRQRLVMVARFVALHYKETPD